MVYTLTLNPALDHIVRLSHLELCTVNRCQDSELRVGGKGINVSLVLSALEIENTALGFIAGHTGNIIESILSEKNISHSFLRASEGACRINTKILCAEPQSETELNGVGCCPSEQDIETLVSRLKALSANDILVLSGSLPHNVSCNLYARLICETPAKAILDTSGKALASALKSHPFLIKPNKAELEEIMGKALLSDDDLLNGCRHLQSLGAKNILLSLGKDGGMLLCEDERIFTQAAPSGKAQYTVGAGDSAVAGFIFGMLRTTDLGFALKCAVAAGSATAFGTSLTDGKRFADILNII